MILYLDTTNRDKIKIALKEGEKVAACKEFKAKYSQAEKLLPGIKKILEEKKIKLSAISEIAIANKSGVETGFTALRIGVVTANALGYGLGVPVRGSVKEKRKGNKPLKFNIIKPLYNKRPNITKQKSLAVD